MNLLTLLLLGASCLSCVSTAFAADGLVPVRAGQHDGYSRLVFDWPDDVSYSVDLPKQDVVDLHFERNSGADFSSLSLSELDFLEEVRQISDDPLTIRLRLPANHKIKYFKLGNKFVFDVLKDVNSAVPIAEPQTQKNKDVESSALEGIVTVDDQPEPSQDLLVSTSVNDKDEKENTATIAIDNLKNHIADLVGLKHKQLAAPKAKKDKREVQKDDVRISKVDRGYDRKIEDVDASNRRPNMIIMSTSEVTSMASFVLNNRLWLVNSDEHALISPTTLGQQIKDMQPYELRENKFAKVLAYRILNGARYDAQGGGFSWKFLIGRHVETDSQPVSVNYRYDKKTGAKMTFLGLNEADEIIVLTNPATNEKMIAVTALHAGQYVPKAMETYDYKILPSSSGLLIVPKVDDLLVKKTKGGILITRNNAKGLVLSAKEDFEKALAVRKNEVRERYGAKSKDGEGIVNTHLLLDFNSWKLGGIKHLSDNRAQILGALPGMNKEGKVQGLMDLARMYIGNGMGAEANGLLTLVEQVWPEIQYSPDYNVLRGVSYAIRGHYEHAFDILSRDTIRDHEEVRYWLSFCLANLHDWQQAISMLPKNFEYIHYYPPQISIMLGTVLTEIALRAGDMELSEELFSILKDPSVYNDMRDQHKASLSYLTGESARQDGRIDDAIEIWEELSQGQDNLYRVRAGLALTRLKQIEKAMPISNVIDRLERLRYAWRGDDLEAQVNFWLGKSYFETGEYIKGLNILRESAAYARSPYLGKRVVTEMRDSFSNIYLSRKLYELSGPDVAALYEHFSELIPVGAKGDLIARRLADRLVQSHLYERAIELLRQQLERGTLSEALQYDVAIRLAAVYQFNEQPSQSLTMLDEAQQLRMHKLGLSEKIPEPITLLTARAYSQNGQVKTALELLSEEPATDEMVRLRADIAWNNSYWEDAAEALEQVIHNTGIHSDMALTDKDADLILRRAVALNLGGDRIRLANIRETYGDLMKETARATAFDVITRPHKSAELADYETLQKVASEVDVFSSFMDGYRGGEFEDAD